MLSGIDPFYDEDPMIIYQKILKGRFKFPRNFNKDAKSIIKHLLVADLTKRYGNLKNGINDIKNHRWFIGLDWQRLIQKRIEMPYKPKIKNPGDTSNFQQYPESNTIMPSIRQSDDPFLNW